MPPAQLEKKLGPAEQSSADGTKTPTNEAQQPVPAFPPTLHIELLQADKATLTSINEFFIDTASSDKHPRASRLSPFRTSFAPDTSFKVHTKAPLTESDATALNATSFRGVGYRAKRSSSWSDVHVKRVKEFRNAKRDSSAPSASPLENDGPCDQDCDTVRVGNQQGRW
eukprot:COSAG01_NODE_6521_length_3623_cov_21.897276_4_plen_169_part_00